MKLERKNFEGVKEKVKDELCCMVPQGVTEILENAFNVRFAKKRLPREKIKKILKY